MNRRTVITLGLAVAVAVVAVDQLSKWWIVARLMQPPQVFPLTPFFNVVLTWNRGVSFGLFNQEGALSTWGLPILALVIVGFLAAWLLKAETRIVVLGIGGVIGGALGNLIDRVNYGAVVDFLDFYVAGYHWPAFNVADAAISVGAAALVYDALFGRAEKNKNRPNQPPQGR